MHLFVLPSSPSFCVVFVIHTPSLCICVCFFFLHLFFCLYFITISLSDEHSNSQALEDEKEAFQPNLPQTCKGRFQVLVKHHFFLYFTFLKFKNAAIIP